MFSPPVAALTETVGLVTDIGFPIAAFLLILRLYREERESRMDERKAWLKAIEDLNKRINDVTRNLEWRQAEWEDRQHQRELERDRDREENDR